MELSRWSGAVAVVSPYKKYKKYGAVVVVVVRIEGLCAIPFLFTWLVAFLCPLISLNKVFGGCYMNEGL